jgi:hypothetical protein
MGMPSRPARSVALVELLMDVGGDPATETACASDNGEQAH